MTDHPIPIFDPRPDVAANLPRYAAALEDVLTSGRFIGGPHVRAFEEEAAAYLGARHAIGVNSGTDALLISLRSLQLGPGDQVVTTPFTFFATSEAIDHPGATTVFADIDPDTLNLDPEAAAAAVTPRTRAVLPVHLFGQACHMDAISAVATRHGLAVLEDVAQAFGGHHRDRKLGTLGDAGAFSFFPTKNLGGFGDGGLVVTDDDAVADRARMLGKHGARQKYRNEVLGYNSRLDEMQAALLRIKLGEVDEANKARRRIADRYDSGLDGVPGLIRPVRAPFADHVFHQYTVRIADGRRDPVREALARAGIGTMVYYPVPLHHLPVYQARGLSLPRAEAAAAEVLSLPMWPQLSSEDQDRIVAAVRATLT